MNIKKIVALLLAIALAGGMLASCARQKEETETEGFDYSSAFDSEGYFKDVKASDYVTLPDYTAYEMPEEYKTASQESIDKELEAIKNGFKTQEKDTDTSREIAEGDKVNIDYVGKIDGTEFEGGSTEGNGTDVTIGVTNYIDGFLDQLIGHKAGESFDINVTFPEDYENEELKGKDAVFSITINHIYKDVYPEINDEFVKENLDLTDKYLVLLDKDYSDMSIKEKYQTISKVPDEEFRLMNQLILNDWKKHELQNLLNNKFVLMQLEYNANAQSKNIKDNLETINLNLNNIRINIAGQNYTLQEIASNLDTLVNISQKSFKELYFIGENIEAINGNTQSIKANTRAVLYAIMQNSKFRDPELSKTIEDLLPATEQGSFSDFLSAVEKKYKKMKDDKKKKDLKQIANLAMIAAAASGIGYIDPSVITGFWGGGELVTHAISAIKPIADTLKHVAIFKAATTGMK